MEDYEKVRFELEGAFVDAYVSLDEKTLWINNANLSILYKKDRSVISRYLKSIMESNVQKQGVMRRLLHIANSDKPVSFYNLDVALMIGEKLKTRYGFALQEQFESFLKNKQQTENKSIIYTDGILSLDVMITPEEETVWLNVEQIATLFGTSTENVYMHIENIFEEGEIDNSVTKDFLVTQRVFVHRAADGKNYNTLFYNLDVILSVGYRVQSKKAIMFRRWANSVLKEYLFKGYVINESRTLVTDENYVNLIHRVDSIDRRLANVERQHAEEKEIIFFDGAYFDARRFMKGLIGRAEKSIILIDPYTDIKTLDYLTGKRSDASLLLFFSNKSKLSKMDIDAFNSQYGGLKTMVCDSFHDRFIILDEKALYHLGASLNYAGKSTFAITKMESPKILSLILEELKRVMGKSVIL